MNLEERCMQTYTGYYWYWSQEAADKIFHGGIQDLD